MSHALTAPPLVKPGDSVAVIAPSGRIDVDDFEAGVAVLRERYDVRLRPDISAQAGYLAGNDARRAAELCDAIDDPAVKAIICARGGYGASRICDAVDLTVLRKRPKWIVGYSDTTVLLAKWAQASVQSIHAPHVQRLHKLDADDRQRWFDALEQPDWSVTFRDLQVPRPGDAVGPLLGGNLALLCALAGTDDFPSLDGAVLLLEDVNEKPYRVDRMLTQLRRLGVFNRVAGVALGRFSQSAPDADGVTVQDVLTERTADLPCPVVAGLPIGHDGPNAPVRLGAVVRITEDRLECAASPGD